MLDFDFVTIAHAAETVHDAAAGAGGLGAIGIDWKALLLQVLNFALLLFLLTRFAYRPIMNVLEQRRTTIEEGLANAKQAEAFRADMTLEAEKLLKEARVKSDALLAEGKKQADKLLSDAEAKAKVRTEQMIKDAETRFQAEVNELRTQLRNETLTLVALATEEVLREKVDSQKDRSLIERAIEVVKKGQTI